jgi:hypothetical protein
MFLPTFIFYVLFSRFAKTISISMGKAGTRWMVVLAILGSLSVFKNIAFFTQEELANYKRSYHPNSAEVFMHDAARSQSMRYYPANVSKAPYADQYLYAEKLITDVKLERMARPDLELIRLP